MGGMWCHSTFMALLTFPLGQLLAPAERQYAIMDIALWEGFARNRRGMRSITIGIDAR